MTDIRLNVQGLARRDKAFQSCILPEPGHRTISIDLSAGEPTVTSHFSQDVNYKYACFDGVGKEPYYSKDGTLMISDIYLMTMSRSPLGNILMRDAFHAQYPAGSFVEQWMADSEVIKGAVKDSRALHKRLALALSYSMGPKKMMKQAYDKGHVLDFDTAKRFYKEYWDLFEGVRRLERKLARQVERKGWIVNPFGYRLTPEPHKAFNYFIQSTVSGIMHLFRKYLAEEAPWGLFVTCIHDELLMDVPEDRIEEFRQACLKATARLNDKLKWSVNVRTGFVAGENWYEAK